MTTLILTNVSHDLASLEMAGRLVYVERRHGGRLRVFTFAGAGIIHVEAGPIPGGEDTPMVCGVWTYYAAGVAERVQAYRGLVCPDCVGLAVTVDRTQLGQRIDIRHAGEWVGPFLVVDVGTGTHRAGLVGEIGNRTAVAWRIPGPWRTCYKEAL